MTQDTTDEQTTKIVELLSKEATTISTVSLYGSRAEITRVARIDLKAGQNRITITGLPDVILDETLRSVMRQLPLLFIVISLDSNDNLARVEGRGAATIHDVITSHTPKKPRQITSSSLDSLQKERKGVESSLYRVSKRLGALENFLSTLNAKDNSIGQVVEVLEGYEKEAGSLQDQTQELERKLVDFDCVTQVEIDTLRIDPGSDLLGKQITVAIFTQVDGPVELVFTYGEIL